MRFQLCEQDRAHFGAPEWLEFDLRNLSVADMTFLSERFGFDPDDWPTPFMGELTLEQAGDPDAVPKPPRWRNHALCWMLLRQNGVKATWDDAAEVHYMLIRSDGSDDAEPDESPGKEDRTTPSDPSDASTTPPSDTSTD
jgi:hypothetical protein